MAITLFIMTIVAVTYSRKKRGRTSVMQHPPYQVVLMGVFAALVVSLASSTFALPEASIPIILLSIAIPIGFVAVSYICIKGQPSRLARLTSAVVAMSIGIITITVVSQTGLFYAVYTWLGNVPLFAGGAAWVAYLWLTRRSS